MPRLLTNSLCCPGLILLFACGQIHKGSPAANVPPLAGGSTSIENRTSGAYAVPAPNLESQELELHAYGDTLFDAEYVNPPSDINPGLGPVFSNSSCSGCHVRNGRGMPAMGRPGTLRSHMLVRLSIDPSEATRFGITSQSLPPASGPIPVPGLGGQLQNHAVFGRDPEANVHLEWEKIVGTFGDGAAFELQRPKISFTGKSENVKLLSDPAVLLSLRQTPPVFGLGLLEAVDEKQLATYEDPNDINHDGISGRFNRVWDPVSHSVTIGRFGWKASAPNLIVQSAAALAEDMGVTNPIFRGLDTKPDIDQKRLDATAYYVQTLAVPARDYSVSEASSKGEQLFQTLACAACHRPQMSTGDRSPIKALQNQEFAPYTDLLLHDMGPGLADHRPDFQANGQEWRTAPLWGIGLTQTVLPHSSYLHDGRARTLEEAILWHGGEAEQAQRDYRALSAIQRRDLLDFLRSL